MKTFGRTMCTTILMTYVDRLIPGFPKLYEDKLYVYRYLRFETNIQAWICFNWSGISVGTHQCLNAMIYSHRLPLKVMNLLFDVIFQSFLVVVYNVQSLCNVSVFSNQNTDSMSTITFQRNIMIYHTLSLFVISKCLLWHIGIDIELPSCHVSYVECSSTRWDSFGY